MKTLLMMLTMLLGWQPCWALDIVKMQKVAENPNFVWVRKMDQAINVQMRSRSSYQYLKHRGYPCCRF
jgi:hypothetical protein